MARRGYNSGNLDLLLPNAVQDYDGNWYDAVILGDQVWLGSNLRTTHCSDGTVIPQGNTLLSQKDPYYYDNTNSSFSLKDRGYFYNGQAVMRGESNSTANPSGVQGIAPDGWHIPSQAEFEQLFNYLKTRKKYVYSINLSGKHIGKALASNSGWSTTDTTSGDIGYAQSTNNKSRFKAVPVGWIKPDGNSLLDTDMQGSFSNENTAAVFMISQKTTSAVNYFTACTAQYYQADMYVGALTFGGHTAAPVRCVCNMTRKQFINWYKSKWGSLNHQVS